MQPPCAPHLAVVNELGHCSGFVIILNVFIVSEDVMWLIALATHKRLCLRGYMIQFRTSLMVHTTTLVTADYIAHILALPALVIVSVCAVSICVDHTAALAYVIHRRVDTSQGTHS